MYTRKERARYSLKRWSDRMPPRRPARQNRVASRDYRLRLPCRPVRRPSSTSNAYKPAVSSTPKILPSSLSASASSGGRRIGTLGPPPVLPRRHCPQGIRAASGEALPQPIVDQLTCHGSNRGRIGYAPNLDRLGTAELSYGMRLRKKKRRRSSFWDCPGGSAEFSLLRLLYKRLSRVVGKRKPKSVQPELCDMARVLL